MAVRFFIHPADNPHETLAFEEACLAAVDEEDVLLYLYRHRPSVIIGRTQNAWAECRHGEMQRDGILLARRITGGGAVYHDKENLNFSFIAGRKVYDVERQLAVILAAVRTFGIEAGFSGRNDILADGRKFSGSAFGVRKNGSVHHGTILIRTDKEKMARYLAVSRDKIAAKGVASVRSRVVNLSELCGQITPEKMTAALRDSFASAYGAPEDWTPGPQLIEQAGQLSIRNGSWEWLFSRSPSFNLQTAVRFDWGGLEMQFRLEHGRICEACIYSDAMDPDFILQIPEALHGIPFHTPAMNAALEPLKNASTVRWVEDIQDFLRKKAY